MATRPPIDCPLCHTAMGADHGLEAHLIDSHTKRALARFIIAEHAAIEQDASE